jgi:hypothetical protein
MVMVVTGKDMVVMGKVMGKGGANMGMNANSLWNLEGRFVVTEPCLANHMSCLLTSKDSMCF